MLGNDIVDLNLAKEQSNWKRKGYLSKIFNEKERALICSTEEADLMVWLLWSMKEAAYKIYNRKTGIREFAPTKLLCTVQANDGFVLGRVSIDDHIYFTQSTFQSSYLHTIASGHQHQLDEIKVYIYESPNHPPKYKNTHPKSTSHHGRYLALIY